MILEKAEVGKQIQKLLTAYPNLNIVESDSLHIRLSGSIFVFRTALNFTVQNTYPVEINVPIGDEALPSIRETGNLIDSNYPHRYMHGGLCLETDTAIRLRFIDGFDLVAWMDEFVEPYFFSYEYYSRYGEYPFGERPHNLIGILHTYQEIFNASDISQAAALLIYSSNNNYRGHVLCPCGSHKKLRNCHGPYLYPFMTDNRKKAIAASDILYIRKELTAIEHSRRNNAKAK